MEEEEGVPLLEELADGMGQMQEPLVGMQQHNEIESLRETSTATLHWCAIKDCISFSELEAHFDEECQ